MKSITQETTHMVWPALKQHSALKDLHSEIDKLKPRSSEEKDAKKKAIVSVNNLLNGCK